MEQRADDAFRDERARYRLKLHCEDCALWDDARDACAHGFPTTDHREEVERGGRVVFCKDFELA